MDLDKAWKLYLLGGGIATIILLFGKLQWDSRQHKKDLRDHKAECDKRYQGLHDKISKVDSGVSECKETISKVNSNLAELKGFIGGLFHQNPKASD